MAFNRSMLTSKSSEWATPPAFALALRAQFDFRRDVCATKETAKAPAFWSKKDDALALSWARINAFMNPPYGRGDSGIEPWMKKARTAACYQGSSFVQLPPARVGTAWWKRYVMNEDGYAGSLVASRYFPEVRVLTLKWELLTTMLHFVEGRLDFEGKTRGQSAPFDSAIVVHLPPNAPRPRLNDDLWTLAHAMGREAEKVPLFNRAWL